MSDMTVAVAGLWHLGTVTAACLASRGIQTIGYDSDVETVRKLQGGEPPLFEPGLADLMRAGLDRGTLRFTSTPADLGDADVLWVAWDTPVDDQDRADVDFVIRELTALFPFLRRDALVLISSQLPVGTARQLEQRYAQSCREGAQPDGRVTFACSPENLRLGKAIEAFTKPERVIVGVRSEADAEKVRRLFAPFEVRIELMGVESAEMTKHALNAFLATSVAFMNEVARVAEAVGADAREVERGLKTEGRIGPRAYLKPGAAYAGGTLARDISYLIARGDGSQVETPLFHGVQVSNDTHKAWMFGTVSRLLGGDLAGARVAVLGLTYKPGTDTLRRSSAVELCERLARAGARPVAFDPAVKSLPSELAAIIELAPSVASALAGSAATIVATEWPEFRTIAADEFARVHASPIVIDPSGFLAASLERDARIRYHLVGKSASV
jgi:UDPglucose 6-dehydrogenase